MTDSRVVVVVVVLVLVVAVIMKDVTVTGRVHTKKSREESWNSVMMRKMRSSSQSVSMVGRL